MVLTSFAIYITSRVVKSIALCIGIIRDIFISFVKVIIIPMIAIRFITIEANDILIFKEFKGC